MSTISPSAPRDEQIAERQHVRAEAQLKIHRRGQSPLAAHVADFARHGEVLAHRLLDQDGRAFRQTAQHAEDLIAGDGDVEDDSAVGAGLAGLGQRAVDRRDAEPLRHPLRRVEAHVEQSGDRQVQALVGRQMGRADDGAGADDDNRLRARRNVPRLPQVVAVILNLSPTREKGEGRRLNLLLPSAFSLLT